MMKQHKLTIQQLANLCNYAWEVDRELGFYMKDPIQFKERIAALPVAHMRVIMDSLTELIRSAHEIGLAEVELKADGTHPFLARLGSARTPTAAAVGVDERLPIPQELPPE
jgi:hypothetical protein